MIIQIENRIGQVIGALQVNEVKGEYGWVTTELRVGNICVNGMENDNIFDTDENKLRIQVI